MDQCEAFPTLHYIFLSDQTYVLYEPQKLSKTLPGTEKIKNE